MFRASLCPSSGAQKYYTVVAACGISCCGFQVAGLVWSWGLCVAASCKPYTTMPIIRSSRVLYSGCCLWYFLLWFSGCWSGVELRVMYCSILQTGHITLSTTPDQQLENHSTKYHRQQPWYNTLELLMMSIMAPETCSASSRICNKNLCCI